MATLELSRLPGNRPIYTIRSLAELQMAALVAQSKVTPDELDNVVRICFEGRDRRWTLRHLALYGRVVAFEQATVASRICHHDRATSVYSGGVREVVCCHCSHVCWRSAGSDKSHPADGC